MITKSPLQTTEYSELPFYKKRFQLILSGITNSWTQCHGIDFEFESNNQKISFQVELPGYTVEKISALIAQLDHSRDPIGMLIGLPIFKRRPLDFIFPFSNTLESIHLTLPPGNDIVGSIFVGLKIVRRNKVVTENTFYFSQVLLEDLDDRLLVDLRFYPNIITDMTVLIHLILSHSDSLNLEKLLALTEH